MGKTIGIIGLWHLGCVLSASWYRLGNRIVGFDYDSDRVKKLRDGFPPLFEPELEETIKKGLVEKRVSFSDDIRSLSECDFVFLSYDTPVLLNDTSDTSILEKSVRDLSGVMKSGTVLVVSSQSPAGYCRFLRNILKESDSSLDIAYSPENLRLGEAIACYLNPGRIILGTADPQTEAKCRDLFSSIRAELVSMNLESAEIVKHGINAFLSMSIVFSNHLADLCEMAGGDIEDVVRGLKTDPRIGQKAYLSPGIGFSGGTLGRDLQVMNRINTQHGGSATLFGTIHNLNSERKDVIVRRIESILGGLEGKTVGILGLTYKPGTSTLRRSLPLEIVSSLSNRGAGIRAYDPKADYAELDSPPLFEIAHTLHNAAESADLLVLLTEWPEFMSIEWPAVRNLMKRPVLFDAKNALKAEDLIRAGFQYHSIGRGDKDAQG
jgi:UDPglucose 6-dehydrogenase